MALKFLRPKGSDTPVKHLIHRLVAGVEEPRKHGTIHASELFKEKEFCPREWAFLDLGVVKKKGEFVGTSMKMTFDHGRDLENRIRNEYIKRHIVGNWRCDVCGHLDTKFGKPPIVACPVCNHERWVYEEVRMEDPVSGVSGGIDALVDVGQKKLRLTEIKSMDKDQHKKLEAPLAEHKMRTALYLYLTELSQYPVAERINTKEGSILYVSKSYGFKDLTLKDAGISDSPFSPFKEFRVGRQDSLLENPLNRAKALTLWRTMREEGTAQGLPCGVCHNGLTKRAQQCSAIGPCFSGSYPGILTWMEGGIQRHPGKPIVA